jgi:hypothetical protein
MKVFDFKLQTCVSFYVKISADNEVIYQFFFSFLNHFLIFHLLGYVLLL